jgi:hypothetical protein
LRGHGINEPALFAIASAIDLPIPREEPVIRATLPV